MSEPTPTFIHFEPYREYRNSGIKWLGQIPTHWGICPLRRKILQRGDGIKIGPFGSQLRLEYMKESGYKVYGQEHVIMNDFSLGYKHVSEEKHSELSAYEIKAGDLIITMMGSGGRAAIVPEDIQPGIMDSHLLRIRFQETEIYPPFIALILDQAAYTKGQVAIEGKGAIMQGLNSRIIKNIMVALPPLSEQKAIVDLIDQLTIEIDELVGKICEGIERLREYRTALITTAVTGQIDVRGRQYERSQAV